MSLSLFPTFAYNVAVRQKKVLESHCKKAVYDLCHFSALRSLNTLVSSVNHFHLWITGL